jgi:acyl-CoA dehydrogenase
MIVNPPNARFDKSLTDWMIPKPYDGLDLPYADYIDRLRALARMDGGQAVAVSVHHSVCVLPIVQFGTAQQQAFWLPLLAKGPGLGAFALTEPGSGSDAAAASLKAEQQADGQFVLNGEKLFITNALTAPVFVVFAQLDGRLTGFLLPNPTPGLTVQTGDHKLGLLTSDWGNLQLDNVVLPLDALLGQAGKGFDIARYVLGVGRIGIAAIALGLVDRCLAFWQTELLTQATTPNRLMEDRLAHWHTQMAGAATLVNQAVDCRLQGLPDATLAASMAKAMASQVCFALAQESMERFGLFHQPAHPVSLAWADAKAMEIVEGTSEIQRVVIAKHVLA